MVDAAVLEKLEAGFAKLQASDSKSLLKKYLTKEVFDNLKNKKTPTFGSTLLDVVQSGFENHDSGVGIYAPDAEAYTVFADLFDPIIEGMHFIHTFFTNRLSNLIYELNKFRLPWWLQKDRQTSSKGLWQRHSFR
jgi:hypothetical protein